MNFTYLTQPPARYTFDQPALKKWTEENCVGKTLNLFAGKNKLAIDEFRVDIDENMPAHYHGDALSFVMRLEFENDIDKFDTIIFDPPYNARKSREKYNGRYIGSITKLKNELWRAMKTGSKIISYGYDTIGMSKSRGFEKNHICIVCHNGDHHDTLIVVETLVDFNKFKSYYANYIEKFHP